MRAPTGIITYSPPLPGDAGNYGWSIMVDWSDEGYLGISQQQDDTLARVLLSPEQVRQMQAILRHPQPKKETQ